MSRLMNLPFVIRNLHAILRLESDVIVDELDLPVGGVSVLFAIAERPGVSQRDVASTTALHKTAIANIVKQLIARELIYRRRSVADARVNALFLTPEGQRIARRAESMLTELRDRAFVRISRSDQDVFFRVSAELIESLRPETQDSDDQ